MSKQPSERAFDVASTWQGHTLWCVIYRDPGQDDADCTCIVRDLALAIDAAIADAHAEAYRQCIALARNSGCHAFAAILVLAAKEKKAALASKIEPSPQERDTFAQEAT